jgi:thiol-disulfide isomerase/thioredoxin
MARTGPSALRELTAMNRLRTITVSLCCLPLACAAFAQGDPKPLQIGDAAPAIEVSAWVKGQPVRELQKGTLYVFDFWATWCEPCNRSMPHLSEIARKYKGKVQVVGVDVREKSAPGRALDDMVAVFVKAKGGDMDYNVCTDDAKKWMMTTWMAAAGEHGIPCAFVIDRDGRIADIVLGYGRGDHRVDDTIEQLLAGTFDYKASAKRHAEEVAKAK